MNFQELNDWEDEVLRALTEFSIDVDVEQLDYSEQTITVTVDLDTVKEAADDEDNPFSKQRLGSGTEKGGP